MNIFETVKAAVTVRQAAEHYGLKINRSGMICCPFHDDRHPSLKLNEDYFYCFGCGAKGDVIDFVARLLDLSAYEAAQRLAADFGLDRPPSVVAQVKKYRPRVNQSKQDELFCMNVLSGYLHLLEDWKERYAPEAPEDEPDERFVEACHKLPPLKSRSFSDSVVANLSRYNLEHTNKITNSAGRRVWGFMGIEAVARPNINGFYDVSPCTYVPEEWRD